jgi:hypothetical protein
MKKHILSQRVLLPFDISLEETTKLNKYLSEKYKGSNIIDLKLDKLYNNITQLTHSYDISCIYIRLISS